MKKRSPVAVLLLPFVTFGIYSIYWAVSTKIEMNKLGTKIPTAWLLIVPLVNIWWLWKYSEGVEQVTKEKMSGVMAFVLMFLLGCIGQAIVQNDFNKIESAPVASAGSTPAPVASSPSPAKPAAPAAQASTQSTPKPPSTPLVQ